MFWKQYNRATKYVYSGATNTVKQVNFPANRPSGAASTDWFHFTLYWDSTKVYSKALYTTTGVQVVDRIARMDPLWTHYGPTTDRSHI